MLAASAQMMAAIESLSLSHTHTHTVYTALRQRNREYPVISAAIFCTTIAPTTHSLPQINRVAVVSVQRKGPVAVHITEGLVEEGVDVEVEVDWERRFDHMQQHSAQHLITAIADRDFGHKTTSW